MKKEKKSSSSSNNPFSSSGLDKFAKTTADLEERRQEIRTQLGVSPSDHNIKIRFRNSITRGWVPVIIKGSEVNRGEDPTVVLAAAGSCNKTTKKSVEGKAKGDHHKPISSSPVLWEKIEYCKGIGKGADEVEFDIKRMVGFEKAVARKEVTRQSGGCATDLDLDGQLSDSGRGRKGSILNWRKRWFRIQCNELGDFEYGSFSFVVVLLSLVMFGGFFAIICTCIWWYLLPVLRGNKIIISPAEHVKIKRPRSN